MGDYMSKKAKNLEIKILGKYNYWRNHLGLSSVKIESSLSTGCRGPSCKACYCKITRPPSGKK